MDTSGRSEITRQQLYEQVWATPLRVLASEYSLSDVGLAKVCKKYAIPRPPVGYWAKVEHGKKVKQPQLPPAPEGVGEVISFTPKPLQDERATQNARVFFDEALGAVAARVQRGELVHQVGTNLRGCTALTRMTREALAAADRKPRRDSRGTLISEPRYMEPYIAVSASKELRQRALLLVDAIVKTLHGLGCEEHPPKDEWNRTAILGLGGYRFQLRIRERTRRTDHVLTPDEKRNKERYSYSFAPKYDYVHTGELFVELNRAGWSHDFFKIKDGKRAGLIEDRIAEIAMAVLQEADRDLERAYQQKLAAERERERRQLAAQEAERRRIEEERLKAEQACRDRLAGLAEDWHMAGSVRLFIAEVRRRLTEETLTADDKDLMERWLCWADRVADECDPFTRSVGDLPECTHPGIKSHERAIREAQASESQRSTDGT
ncbi:MAG: hypothetical protein JJU33_04305 [Phycisphaerales bacterium]|nr:hypothetical protein [Phycisphaerales bacterium]